MNLLPFAMLALAAGLAFGINGGSSSKLLTEAALTAAAASWMLVMLALRHSWEQRPRLSGALLARLIALMVALVIVNPTFGFFAWTGYIWTFRLVQTERWRALGLVATSVATGTSQHGGLPNRSAGGWISWLAIVAINLLAVSVVSWFVRVREREADERQQAISDLTEAIALRAERPPAGRRAMARTVVPRCEIGTRQAFGPPAPSPARRQQ